MLYYQSKLLLPHHISGDAFRQIARLLHKKNNLKIYDTSKVEIKPR